MLISPSYPYTPLHFSFKHTIILHTDVKMFTPPTSDNQMNPDPSADVGPSYVVPVLTEYESADVVDEESREEGIRDSVPDTDNVVEPRVVEAPLEVPVVDVPVVVPCTSGPPVTTSRRSGRQLTKPAWMQSGEYDMEM